MLGIRADSKVFAYDRQTSFHISDRRYFTFVRWYTGAFVRVERAHTTRQCDNCARPYRLMPGDGKTGTVGIASLQFENVGGQIGNSRLHHNGVRIERGA